jgi:hypothetical protein
MRKIVQSAKLAAILVAALGATAHDLRAAQPESGILERRAVVTELSTNASATTYWVAETDGWHVVTTIDIVFQRGGDAEQHAVARFSATLQPGQVELISVPYATGQQQRVLRIRRVGDRIEVARVSGSSV